MSRTPQLYEMYGLRVRSDVALHERELAPRGAADLTISVDRPAISKDDLFGTTVAEHEVDERVLYRIVRQAGGAHVMRAYGVGDFHISPDASLVRCRPDLCADHGLLAVLLRGTVMAAVLEVRGRTTLHASAVEVGGTGLAFAGMSGAGKTTTAALLCAAGARLITDDVLAVDLGDAGPQCVTGSVELRLRPAAVGLLDAASWCPPRRVVADGRLAIRPAAVAAGATVPLGAIVFAVPGRGNDRVELRQLKPVDAVFRLASVPRINGWACPQILGRSLDHVALLAEQVPVYDAVIPWGPPWRPELVLPIADALCGVAA